MTNYKDDRYGVFDRHNGEMVERFVLVDSDQAVGTVMEKAEELNQEHGEPDKWGENGGERRFIAVEEKWNVYRELAEGVHRIVAYGCYSPEDAEKEMEEVADVENTELKVKRELKVL